MFKPHGLKLCASLGFSLVEMMIVLAIFTMISGGLYSVFAAGDSSWQVNKVKMELRQELRKAMEGMINDLRQAGSDSIEDVPANGGNYAVMTFKIPDNVASGTLIWNEDTIQYGLGGLGGNQLLRVEGGQTRVIAQNIDSVYFSRPEDSPDALQINLTAEKTPLKGKTMTYPLSFEVQLRN